MQLKVNEMFCSIQGEGARVGTLNHFIRLAGCDLTCSFCDTEFESYREGSLEDIIEELAIINSKCFNIIWTGGEPTLQLTQEVVEFFRSKGFYQAIETNGNNKVPEGIDYITVSPKVAEHVLKKNFTKFTQRQSLLYYDNCPFNVDELRYTRSNGQQIPEPQILARNVYLSPIFNGNTLDQDNLDHCIHLIHHHPEWKLSVQVHKLIGVL